MKVKKNKNRFRTVFVALIIVIIIFIVAMAFSGSTQNILTCKVVHGMDEATKAEPTTTLKLEYNKKGTTLKKITKIIDADFSNAKLDAETFKTYKTGLNEMCGMYSNVDSCSVQQKDQILSLVLQGELHTLNISGLDAMQSTTYDDMKAFLTEQGYACR